MTLDQHRPEQRADDRRQPAAESRSPDCRWRRRPRTARIDSRSAARKWSEHCDRTENTRIRKPQMGGPRGHQRQRQRVLAQHHAVDDIEREARRRRPGSSRRRAATRCTNRTPPAPESRGGTASSTAGSGKTASASATSADSTMGMRRIRVSRIMVWLLRLGRGSWAADGCRRGGRRRQFRGLRLQPHEHEFARTVEAAAGFTSTSASDCAGSRLTSAIVPTG